MRGAAAADGAAARFVARVDGAARAPASLRLEARWAAAEAALGEASLVLAPPEVRVWIGAEGPVLPQVVEEKK